MVLSILSTLVNYIAYCYAITQSNNDGRSSIGQCNNISAEMRQLQETVSHLQKFCNIPLQAVTPHVSGNQIVLPPSTYLATTSVTRRAQIFPTTGERRHSRSSATDSLHYRNDHHSFMAKLDVRIDFEKHWLNIVLVLMLVILALVYELCIHNKLGS